MPTERDPTLTNADHRQLDNFMLMLMEAVRDGRVTPLNAASEVVHLLAAADIANYTEPRAHSAMAEQIIDQLSRQN